MVFIKDLILLPFTARANLPLVLLEQDQIRTKDKFTAEDKAGIYGQTLQLVSRAPQKYQGMSGSCTYETRNAFGTNLNLCPLKMQQLLCTLQD